MSLRDETAEARRLIRTLIEAHQAAHGKATDDYVDAVTAVAALSSLEVASEFASLIDLLLWHFAEAVGRPQSEIATEFLNNLAISDIIIAEQEEDDEGQEA